MKQVDVSKSRDVSPNNNLAWSHNFVKTEDKDYRRDVRNDLGVQYLRSFKRSSSRKKSTRSSLSNSKQVKKLLKAEDKLASSDAYEQQHDFSVSLNVPAIF